MADDVIMGTLRKILTTGVGAALMTESSLRNALSEIKLTQQAREYFARQLHEEIQKALCGLTLEIQATVKISPRDSAKKENRFTVRRLKIRKLSGQK